jgi:hypothetical protein
MLPEEGPDGVVEGAHPQGLPLGQERGGRAEPLFEGVVDALDELDRNELVGNTPDEFAQVIRSDLAKYGKLVKAAGIQQQ